MAGHWLGRIYLLLIRAKCGLSKSRCRLWATGFRLEALISDFEFDSSKLEVRGSKFRVWANFPACDGSRLIFRTFLDTSVCPEVIMAHLLGRVKF